ncbi:hypothetical protein POM88_014677 [Heracleum sosnowskyi]|uniref:Pentatricopeptide repeat-containing protein n=1 Tax=Heracleum sosnowskyi TaxID=360622 RepID=A0AAD8IIG0_9APIA|nr:hypothetical protein POM88_014677 [Heracleum sosnowskyi]
MTFNVQEILFHNSNIARLQADLSYTRNELVTALLYRCAISAAATSNSGEYAKSVLIQMVNVRSMIDPPLLQTSLGNFANYIHIPTSSENETNLNLLAERIRKGKMQLRGSKGINETIASTTFEEVQEMVLATEDGLLEAIAGQNDKNSSVLEIFAKLGRVGEVLASFNKMISENFKPNYVTFLAVLCARSHGGLVDEGCEYFQSMTRDFGIQPRGKHYAAVVDILARAGRLEEAYAFVRDSSCKERSVI